MSSIAKEITSFKESLFSVFYIMAESTSSNAPSRKTWAWAFLLLAVEFGQNIGRLLSTGLGWDVTFAEVFSNFDVAYIFAGIYDLKPLQVYLPYISALLVVFAVSDAAYVLSQFRKRKFQNIWTAKILRVIVKAIVSILYSSVFGYIIHPMSCGFYQSFPMGAGCKPSAFPNVLVALVFGFLGFIYFVFAILSSLLFIAYDPLTLDPMAQSSGRADALYTIIKSVIIVLPLFPTTAIKYVVIVLFLLLLWHINLLYSIFPSHRVVTNLTRLALSSMLAWVSLCTGVMCFTSIPQNYIVYVMVPGCVVTFFGGAFVGWRKVKNIRDKINSIRLSHTNQRRSATDIRSVLDKKEAFARGSFVSGDNKVRPALNPSSSSVFFDISLKTTTFADGHEAVIAGKMLLSGRSRNDLDFIEHILVTTIEDIPTFPPLTTWTIAFASYAKEHSATVPSLLERTKRIVFDFDLDFILFSIRQKQVQGLKGADVGTDALTAIGLIELTKEQDTAAHFHLSALRSAKRFWSISLSLASNRAADPGMLVVALQTLQASYLRAKNSYADLVVKFPNAVSLLHANADFLETLGNDIVGASELRARADLLSQDRNEGDKTEVTSSSKSGAMRAAAKERWKLHILEDEGQRVDSVYALVRKAMIVLVVIFTLSFVLIDVLLFAGSQERSVDYIITNGNALTQIARILYLARDAVSSPSNATFSVLRAAATNLSETLELQYETISAPAQRSWFDESELSILVPLDTIHTVVTQRPFHDAVEAFAKNALDLASAANLRTNSSFEVARSSRFVFENGLRSVWHAIEISALLSQADVAYFSGVATICLVVNAVVCLMIVLFIEVLMYKMLGEIVAKFRSTTISCAIASIIPRRTRRNLTKFYKEAEDRIKVQIRDDDQSVFPEDINDPGAEAKGTSSGPSDDHTHVGEEGGVAADERKTMADVFAASARADDDAVESPRSAGGGEIFRMSAREISQIKEDKGALMRSFAEGRQSVGGDPSGGDVVVDVFSAPPAAGGKIQIRDVDFDGDSSDEDAALRSRGRHVQFDYSRQGAAAAVNKVASVQLREESLLRHRTASSISSAQPRDDGDSSAAHLRKAYAVIFFAAAMVFVFAGLADFILSDVAVRGGSSEKLFWTMDLLTDIVPPALNLLDVFAHALQFAFVTDPIERAATTLGFELADTTFSRRFEFWAREIPADLLDLRRAVVFEMFAPVQSFFSTLREQVIPLVASGRHQDAFDVLIATPRELYGAQTTSADAASALCAAEISRLQALADFSKLRAGIYVGAFIVSALTIALLLLFSESLNASLTTALQRAWALLRRFKRVAPDSPLGADGGARPQTTSSSGAPTEFDVRVSESKKFQRKVLLVGAVYFLAMGAYAAAIFVGSSDLQVLGDKYVRLATLRTLNSELANPPLFAQRALTDVLLFTRGANLSASSRAELLQDFNKSRTDFLALQSLWCDRPIDAAAKTKLCGAVRDPALKMFDLFASKIVPMVESGRSAQAEAVLSLQLLPLFRTHEMEADQLVRDLKVSNSVNSFKHYYTRDLSQITYAIAAGCILAGVALLAWVLAYEPAFRPLKALDMASYIVGEGRKALVQRLVHLVAQTDPTWFRRRTHAICFGLLLLATAVCILMPLRHVVSVNQLAPLAAQSGRRTAYAALILHFAREMNFNDGVTAMTATFARVSLENALNELEEMHSAIKRGGAFSIDAGVSGLDREQTDLLFKPSCLNDACGANSSFPDAISNGLDHALDVLGGIVRRVLANAVAGGSFDEGMANINRSRDLRFLKENFDGPIMDGLTKSARLVVQRSEGMFRTVHNELRALYGVYVALLLLGFFFLYFRRTVQEVKGEAEKVRTFVTILPLRAVDEGQGVERMLKSLFVRELDDDDVDDVV